MKPTEESREVPSSRLSSSVFRPVTLYPLIAFRFTFGLAMAFWCLYMLLSGSVTTYFIEPNFVFSYTGFEWLKPLPDWGIYLSFVLLFFSALMISAGMFFRVSSLIFTLLFAYLVLLDRANYLSYYYFILLLSFMLMISPAHRIFSIDLVRKPELRVDFVPRWIILAIQVQVALVFVFAGMAKLNPDWLFEGRPINIWLTQIDLKYQLGLPGFLKEGALPLVLSWFLILFDFIIPHFLLDKKTGYGAYLMVVCIQLIAFLLFPTGFFPVLISAACIIFIPEERIHRVISGVSYFLYDVFSFKGEVFNPGGSILLQYRKKRLFPFLLLMFFGAQVLLPVGLFLNWGSKRWEDAAFRFSWDIRMQEKTGNIQLWVVDSITQTRRTINLNDYLMDYQQERMAEDPHMIRQFVHHLMLEKQLDSSNRDETIIASSVVSLNGKAPQTVFEESWELNDNAE